MSNVETGLDFFGKRRRGGLSGESSRREVEMRTVGKGSMLEVEASLNLRVKVAGKLIEVSALEVLIHGLVARESVTSDSLASSPGH